MLNKQAKVILKKIQKNAKENRTYYVILDTFWPHGSSSSPAYQAYEMGANDVIWKDINKLEERYQRFCHYIKEVKPQWRDVKPIYYADNSIEMIQENDKGERRKVMMSAPSGDIC